MTTLASLSKNKTTMVEQINDNVFRVHRSDLAQRPTEIFDHIQSIVKSDASYLIARKRSDANINGSIKLIEDIENDYRSTYFVIVHRNPSYAVRVGDKTYKVTLNRYETVISITDTTNKELLNNAELCSEIMLNLANDKNYKAPI